MRSLPTKRPWFQFSLATAIVLMLMASGVVGIVTLRIKYAGVTDELRALEFADPEADATKAIAKRDFRFIGVSGAINGIPGVTDDAVSGDLKIAFYIETTDCSVSDEQCRLQCIAHDYAEKYNRIIWDELYGN